VTDQAVPGDSVWVLDATCLSHFVRAERLDVFRDLLVGKECWTIWLLAGTCRGT
jgi:hypothetical protein